MWPWGHLGVAYLLYAGYTHIKEGRPPRGLPVVAVVLGSQVADLIDKPLSWVGLLSSGRSLAHSAVFAGVLITLAVALGSRWRRLDVAVAFSIGHVSHLLADLPPRLLLGYPFGTEFLYWPFLDGPIFGYNQQVFEPPSIVETVVTPLTDRTVFRAFEWLLFVVAALWWYRDGCPGLRKQRQM